MLDFKPDARPPGKPAGSRRTRPPRRQRKERPSVFAYSLWIHCADAFCGTDEEEAPTVEVPTPQWMAAIGRRTLTPAEQAARKAYFDQQIARSLSRTA